MPPEIIDVLRSALPSSYTVDRYLCKGGQGAVFLGKYQGKKVALKLFNPHDDQRRIDREINLLQSMSCNHLVRIEHHDRIVLGGIEARIVSYEYLPGGDLTKLLHPSANQLDESTLTRIGLHVGVAVESLWKKKIVHRDVKPANIVQADGDRYVLVDVGFARFLDLSDLTAAGAAPGTMGYKSPEQAKGRKHLTIHSDAFSLGLTLYELAAKKHPYDGNQANIGILTPPCLKEVRPDLSDSIVRLIHQMLGTSPGNRPSDLSARFVQLKGN